MRHSYCSIFVRWDLSVGIFGEKNCIDQGKRGGGCTQFVHYDRSRMTIDPRIPMCRDGARRVFTRTRQALLAPGVKSREMFGESHEG